MPNEAKLIFWRYIFKRINLEPIDFNLLFQEYPQYSHEWQKLIVPYRKDEHEQTHHNEKIEFKQNLVGKKFFHFNVLSQISNHPWRSLYVIWHKSLRAHFYLFVFHADIFASEARQKYFWNAQNAIKKLKQRSLYSLPAINTSRGDHNAVSRFLKTVPLQQLLQKRKIPEAPLFTRSRLIGVNQNHLWLLLFAKLASELSKAHAVSVIHGRLNPSCCLVTPEHNIILVDFGLPQGKLTETDAIHDTERYLAPEQFHNQDALSAASDIFAIGVMMYEFFAGRNPFANARTRNELCKSHTQQIISLRDLNPQSDERLSRLLMKMLAAKSEDRIQNLSVVTNEIHIIIEHGLIDAAAPFWRPKQKMPWRKLAVGATFAGLIWLGVMIALKHNDQRHSPDVQAVQSTPRSEKPPTPQTPESQNSQEDQKSSDVLVMLVPQSQQNPSISFQNKADWSRAVPILSVAALFVAAVLVANYFVSRNFHDDS